MTNNKEKKTLTLGKGKLTLKKPSQDVLDKISGSKGADVTIQVKKRRRPLDNLEVAVEKDVDNAKDIKKAPETSDDYLTDSERENRLKVLKDSKSGGKNLQARLEEQARQAEQEAEQRRVTKAEKAKAEIEVKKLEEERLKQKATEEKQAKQAALLKEKTEKQAKPSVSSKPSKPLSAAERRLQEQRETADKQAALMAAERDARNKTKSSASQGMDDADADATARPAGGLLPKNKTLQDLLDDDNADAQKKKKKTKSNRTDNKRGKGRMTVTEAMKASAEASLEDRKIVVGRHRKGSGKTVMPKAGTKIKREVVLPDVIAVQELAVRMSEKTTDVIKALMKMGVMATINQSIDADTAELIVGEFGHTIKRVSESDVEADVVDAGKTEDSEASLKEKPPVVTVMGHVDHGKTSLLDALRTTDVAAGEAGGITQHIGAYQVKLSEGGKLITFLDTPGHEAFTAMRSRGAKVTDVVVLVVAADDGIQPQTIEAINHAKAAEVPLIVAINKIDKPGVDPIRIKTDLLQHDVQIEEMGGDVLCVEVSAKERLNLDKLEEAIMLQAELLDIRANPDRNAVGSVVESKMEKGRGAVATVLIQHGTLNVGDILVAGAFSGRVRALMDDRGRQQKQAGPSMPVEVLGLEGCPSAGDEVVVVDSEAKARQIAEYRQRRERETHQALQKKSSVDDLFAELSSGARNELPILIKADVQGSIEAIVGSLQKLATDEVSVKIVHTGVGGINESDITLAGATNAFVIGFNVRASASARQFAEEQGLDIRYYSIIYNIIDDTKALLSGMLAPEIHEDFLGYADIREVFNITKVGRIAGCRVTEGLVKRACKVRLLRENVVIYEGSLKSLKHFKDEVKEVKSGLECGIQLENFQDIKLGDVLECFDIKEVKRQL